MVLLILYRLDTSAFFLLRIRIFFAVVGFFLIRLFIGKI
jgi:hypothetical protein